MEVKDLLEYDCLNEETNTFIKKVIDVYSSVEGREIIKTFFKYIDDPEEYKFTKSDKKMLALLIAGFLTDGNLKEILLEHNDIKLDDLFDFLNISESDIKQMNEEAYKDYYGKNLKWDLINLIEFGISSAEIKQVTPEVIIYALDLYSIRNCPVLNQFARTYKLRNCSMFFSDHRIFDELKTVVHADGSLIDKKYPENSEKWRSDFENLFKSNPSKLESNPSKLESNPSKQDPDLESQLSKDVKQDIKLGDDLWKVMDEIKGKFIGQESFAEELFYNIVNNQLIAQMPSIPDGQRSIIFVDGPSGTGKTAITREITSRLNIPCCSSSITSYSGAGYVGANLTDILFELYKKANGNLELAERGIVVLDEFDKLVSVPGEYSQSEMKRQVQQQLLDFLGGGKYTINVSDMPIFKQEVKFDTSKLTFVCLGALTDIRKKKLEKPKQGLGFGQDTIDDQNKETTGFSLTPEDLIYYGLSKELVGRFNTYMHTDDYSIESLKKILVESTISPLLSFQTWVESLGKKLVIEDDVYDIIAEQAYLLNTGARSLQTVVNNIRTHYIKEVLRGNSDTIYLDSNTVVDIYNQTMTRKGRA